MKLLNLFHGGASGASGASLQQKDFFSPHSCPTQLPSGAAERTSCPTRPTSNLHGGAEESVAAVGLPHSPHSPHSETEQNISEHPDTPSPAQLGHALRMRVPCPVESRNLHRWHCSRCPKAGTCKAWLPRRADVEFFRGSEKPYSLILMEERGEKGREEDKGTGQGTPSVSDYAAFCSSYWRGCRMCPDYVAGQLRFCGRYNRTIVEAAQVLQ